MSIKYFCDNCKKEVSDMELNKTEIPVVETVYAMGGKRGQQKLMRWDNNLGFEELALCEKCQEKHKEVWDYGMNVIAEMWKQIKDK